MTAQLGSLSTGMRPAIAALRPSLVVFENVQGLLTIEHGQVLGQVLADLDALGYTVSWTTVGACRMGACHHRHRIFLAATLGDVAPPPGEPVAHRVADGWVPIQDVLFGATDAVKWSQAGHVAAGLVWSLPSQACGSTDGVLLPTPTARDATRGAGRKEPEGRPLSDALALLPTPRASDAAKGGPNQRGSSGDLMLPSAVQPERFAQFWPAVRRHQRVFSSSAPEPVEPGVRGGWRMSAAFPEWMMCLPPGWITDHPLPGVKPATRRADAIRIAGLGVVPTAASYALSTLPTFQAARVALSREAVAA